MSWLLLVAPRCALAVPQHDVSEHFEVCPDVSHMERVSHRCQTLHTDVANEVVQQYHEVEL